METSVIIGIVGFLISFSFLEYKIFTKGWLIDLFTYGGDDCHGIDFILSNIINLFLSLLVGALFTDIGEKFISYPKQSIIIFGLAGAFIGIKLLLWNVYKKRKNI